MATPGSARAARTCATSCARTRRSPARSRSRCAARPRARPARRWRRRPRSARGPVSRADARVPDAFETALRLLTLRPHSEAELRRKLVRRGCPADDVESAVARARGLGYLDDAAFARALAGQRART